MGHDGAPDPLGPTDWGTQMRVVVDFDLCESNAVCMGIAPEVFEVRDDDFLYVLQENPPEELRGKVEEAVQRCPKQAISIAED
jgi:ferredoxin